MDRLESELRRAMKAHLERRRHDLNARALTVASSSPVHRLARLRGDLDMKRQRLFRAQELQLARRRQRLATAAAHLDGLNPLAILERGYAILTDEEGRIIRRARDSQPGMAVRARLAEGYLDLEVTGTRNSD